VKLSLNGIAEVADKFCNQDTAGFNAAVACVVIDLAKTAGALTFEVLAFRDGNIDSDTMDATFECVQDINAAVDKGNNDLKDIKQKVIDLDQKLNDVQAQLMEIMDTLRTPFGRREGFNDN
jgi:hypothetical protein